jgi:protein O-mannosyl-transferase
MPALMTSPHVSPDHPRTDRWLSCALLLAVTATVYWQVAQFEFTNYDDWEVVAKNPVVKQGLTPPGVIWAFTTHYYDYWHPVAWLSHMLDVQLFGSRAGMHHLSSLFIHLLNVGLVLVVFWRLTGAWGKSFFVAALFALHPLNVDSVAWIAERKNLVSTTFWLLTMWAYVAYVERVSAKRYMLTLGLFAVGLMAKPMLITLPFAFLLLDYWPLRRFARARLGEPRDGGSDAISQKVAHVPAPISRLLLEKIPFLLLAVASMLITYGTAHAKGFVVSTELFPLHARMLSVPVAYAAYFLKTLWPLRLAVFYPHPGFWPLWKVAGSSVLLLALSLAILAHHRRPYLLVGWLWFLGTLVPVIGFIQTGQQYMADRWTYVPDLGLFWILVWGAADLTELGAVRQSVVRAGGVAVLVVCAVLTLLQARHWRNTVTLFSHALAVTQNNHVAHYNLGLELMSQGKVEEPLHHFAEATRIRPDYADAYNNRGLILASLGRWQEATNQFIRAIQAKPDYSKAHNNLGYALFSVGNPREATNQFFRALTLNSTNANTWYNIGQALAHLGHPDQAISYYQQALRLAPDDPATHNWMGKALVIQGKQAEAIVHFREALRLQGDYEDAHFNLGVALMAQGQFTDAFAHLAEAVRLNPSRPEGRWRLAEALLSLGHIRESLAEHREALRRNPDLVGALNNLAWLLATYPIDQFRDGSEARELAEHACSLTGRQNPTVLGTLAAAYAEAGQFEKAATTAEEASRLAEKLGQQDLAATNRILLELYRQGKPLRDRR